MTKIRIGKRKIFLGVSLALTAFLITQFLFAGTQHNQQVAARQQEPDSHEAAWPEEVEEEEFNAGESIIEHIIDSHEWHIATLGETHISIPLPVILWHDGKLHIFMSSKLHHGHASYKGFRLMTEGEFKGKILHDPLEDPDYNYLDEEIVAVEQEGGKKQYDVPLDFSITKNVAAIFISMIIMSWMFISIAKRYKKRKGEAPKGLQSLLEPLILFIRDDVAKEAIGVKRHERYLPFLFTLFFFIFLNNLLGLVPFFPGGANVTGNIAVTGVMAVFTFLITTFSANKNYWKHIFNTPGVPWWLKIPIPIMPLVEFMGIFTKPFVLMVRLFANITAGHIIVLGFISLVFIFGNIQPAMGYGVSIVSIAFAVFMGLLELLVAFIQAYVFTLLSALYFGMATEDHH
ncbi:MAG: F0F1 ATP synthase subunit A [Bacteroidales bacterium]|nr:F0F1 ATP synthase subunit A [Bacteroidales bacterium]MCF8350098.1 F0F1 ATP synthase subunit A [Bacteroidales bacterium]MCF8376156.1 F0F1 ATP synthase subunit A [Bacteroidales bacterium]